MSNVQDIKEESITDYLVWKWRELDQRFKYINVKTFTKHEENTTTGADFELELWLVGKNFHLPLIFQAKKFIKPYDSYVKKLNYPKGTQSQLNKLISCATKNKKLPFYMIYSLPDSDTKTMCNNQEVDTALFMVDAHTIKEIADGKLGRRISKNELLKHSNPFHCLFCCPLTRLDDYFTHYFPISTKEGEKKNNETLPNYVSMILDGSIRELSQEKTIEVINQNELRSFRTIGVYDCRELPELIE